MWWHYRFRKCFVLSTVEYIQLLEGLLCSLKFKVFAPTVPFLPPPPPKVQHRGLDPKKWLVSGIQGRVDLCFSVSPDYMANFFWNQGKFAK